MSSFGNSPTDAVGPAGYSDIKGGDNSQTVAAGQLRAIIERIERLESDKADISSDIKDVYAEAKGTGFDTKAIRTLIRMRKKDSAELQEEMSILELYGTALGMGCFG